ncbi:MAG: hypothetical protein R3250_08400 [Melioribacteraceae bacterium]|nr:hypothetical protein [Melioribacteraceae bacterium]
MKKLIIALSLIGLIGCAQENIVEIEGRVAVKGSSPHTYLSIKDSKSHKSYKIQNQSEFDLMTRQNQTLKVKAVLIKEAVGPGFPAVIEVVEVK